MQTKRRRRRQWPTDILDALEEALLAGRSVKRALDYVKTKFPDRPESDFPTLRTAYDIKAELPKPANEVDAWSLMDADPEDAAVVLPVMADVTRRFASAYPGSGAVGFTKQVADKVAHLRRAIPDLPAYESFRFGIRYAMAEVSGHSTYWLDIYLALRLWESKEAEQDAIRNGLIPANWSYTGPKIDPGWPEKSEAKE